jgi:ATP-binding cassette subfamily B protein
LLFAVAHRLSTVKNANKVVVVHRGEVAEMGTHEELLRRSGLYEKLVRRQLMQAEPLHAAPSATAEAVAD